MGDGYSLSLFPSDRRRLWAWGNNFYGQLGLGHHSAVLVPTLVPVDVEFTQLFFGSHSVFALDSTCI